MRLDVLDYAPNIDAFFFKTKNMNASKVFGVTRVASKHGGFAYKFPCTYPDGYLGAKDFKSLIGGKATSRAANKLSYLKDIPNKIDNTEYLSKSGLEFKRAPYPHQLEVAETMLHYKRLAVLLEQGLGKTYITHMYLQALQSILGRSLKMVVLAPVIVLLNWYEETMEHTPFKPFLYTGTMEQRLKKRELLQEGDWDILITNYETLVPPSKDFTKAGLINWWLGLTDERKKEVSAFWFRKDLITRDEKNYIQTVKTKKVKGKEVRLKKYETEVYKILKTIPESSLLSPDLLSAQRELDDLNFLKQLSFDVAVLDEGSRIKGYKSKRSHAVQQLIKDVDRRYVLSGTLCLGDPRDVYMPMTLLNENIFGTNYHKFEKKYANYSPYNKHVIVSWKNLDHLKMRMDPYIISKKREDCLSLPSRIMDKRYYEISEHQKEVYNDIVENDIIEVDDFEINVELPIIKLNKLRQVLSGFLIKPAPRGDLKCNSCEHVAGCVEEDVYPWQPDCPFYGKWHLYGEEEPTKPEREYYEFNTNPKLDLLLEDLKLGDEKTIIWVYYKYDLDEVKALLQENNINFITASEYACDLKFEGDDSIKVFLGQISQGIGITLNSATCTIYYSHGLGLEPRLQSLDRNHRIGQSKNVLVKDYMCRSSIEERVVHLLKHKEDVKDFIQSKADCLTCKDFEFCMEREIQPYSEKCSLSNVKEKAETKKLIRLNTL